MKIYCEALTTKGNPCRKTAMLHSNPPRCGQHSDQAAESAATFTAERKAQFLAAYSQTLNLTEAATAIGMSTDRIGNWRTMDPEFNADVIAAKMACVHEIEGSFFQRAIGLAYTEETWEPAYYIEKGVKVYSGEPILTKRVHKVLFDTRAGEILLRANDPAKYSQHGPVGGGNIPRQSEEEERMRKIQSDPAKRKQLDALLDSDLD